MRSAKDFFRPKAIGCWLLHEATRHLELDHFVCYSSISAVFGNPGQVSYVAANSFLATCFIQASSGLVVQPAKCTRRVATSIKSR